MSQALLVRPHLERLWAAFPDHERYPTLNELFTMMGGVAARNIGLPGFPTTGNTCASRISYALNHGGSPIAMAVARAANAETIGTEDGTRIIAKVAHLKRYLNAAFGKPEADNVKPYDDAFRSKKGIIAFTVDGWNNASGHIALARFGHYREPSHDDYGSFALGRAHTVLGEFWELI